MLKHKRLGIMVLVITFIAISIFMFKQYNFDEYKRSYQEGDKVEQVDSLMRTGKYVTHLKEAGYSYSEKNTDKGLSKIKINPKLNLELVKPFNRQYHIYITMKKQDKKILADMSFNQNGECIDANYIWFDDKNMNHPITLPKSDEDRLVRQVQKEVDDFLDTMYHQIYDK